MSQRLTVAQILPQMNSGGVERGTMEVNRALVEAGHRSIVISGGGRLIPQLENEGGDHPGTSVLPVSCDSDTAEDDPCGCPNQD